MTTLARLPTQIQNVADMEFVMDARILPIFNFFFHLGNIWLWTYTVFCKFRSCYFLPLFLLIYFCQLNIKAGQCINCMKLSIMKIYIISFLIRKGGRYNWRNIYVDKILFVNLSLLWYLCTSFDYLFIIAFLTSSSSNAPYLLSPTHTFGSGPGSYIENFTPHQLNGLWKARHWIQSTGPTADIYDEKKHCIKRLNNM